MINKYDTKYERACRIFNTPADWLKYYYTKFGSFFVQHQGQDFISKWIKYKGLNGFGFEISERQVMPIEIIIDIDGKDKTESRKLLKEVINSIKNLFNYSVWSTTSKGFHIHLFFPDLETITGYERKIMKSIILEHIKEISEVEEIDLGMIHEKKLVNLEYGKHRKTGKRKHLIEFNKSFSTKNKIPRELWTKFHKRRSVLNSKRGFVRKESKDEPPCIRFLNSVKFSKLAEGRRRALFILCSNSKQKMSNQELFIYLRNWRNSILYGYPGISDNDIQSTIQCNTGRAKCPYIQSFLKDLGKQDICLRCPHL